MPYQTRQQQAILHRLEEQGAAPLTAAELAEALRQDGCPVGLATIYRQLERLERQGSIHKITTEEGAFYQLCPHQGENHPDCVLLRCRGCGRVSHLDCGQLQGLYRHLEAAHHFRVDLRRTVLTGLCGACTGEEDEHDR